MKMFMVAITLTIKRIFAETNKMAAKASWHRYGTK